MVRGGVGVRWAGTAQKNGPGSAKKEEARKRRGGCRCRAN